MLSRFHVRTRTVSAILVAASTFLPVELAFVLNMSAPIAAAQSANSGNANDIPWDKLNAEYFQPAPTLDYVYFRENVEPIFLKRRSAEHAHCILCHRSDQHFRVSGINGFNLVPPTPGRFWTEEESHKNYTALLRVVAPGHPLSSLLVIQPLAPEAGGLNSNHSGGRQFSSQSDPDFQILVAWVNGAKLVDADAGNPDDKLPAGAGRELVLTKCAVCHTSGRIVRSHLAASAWNAIVGQMIQYGADVDDKDRATIVDYLSSLPAASSDTASAK